MIVAVCAALAGPARADDEAPEEEVIAAEPDPALVAYRDAIERGTAAFRRERFVEAREAFTRAFAIHPEPVLQFNIASCWRRAGEPDEAIAAYRRFLALAPAGDPRRSLALETIDELGADPEPAAPPEPTPPTIELTAARDGFAPAPRRSALRPTGMVIAAVGVATLIASGVEAARARSFQSDLENQNRPRWDSRQADTYRRGETASRASLILGISGAVLTASGLTLYYVGHRAERELRISAKAGADRGELVVSGRF
ncbi:MAG: hypothetical protein K8W52_15990 [Deltaproteobacteria bacterium]|nr:hypothetical protein [Deltaproteobacteria bacterium]